MGADARWHGKKDGKEQMDKSWKDEEKPAMEQPTADKGMGFVVATSPHLFGIRG